MASLQYSMPVQAIVPRRQADGRASRPISAQRADQRLGPLRRHVEHQQLLVRGEPHPVAAVRLDHVGELGELRAGDPPDHRGGAHVVRARRAAGARRCGRSAWRAAPAPGRRAACGRGTPSPAPRGSAPRPSRRPGTSAGPGCAAGGSRSRGRSRPPRPRRPAPRASGTQTPSRLASIGLVERPPPTQTSKPGPCSGCSTPRKEMSFDLVRGVDQPGDRRLELAGQVGVAPCRRRTGATISSIAGVGSSTLVLGDPGDRAAQHDPGAVAARLGGLQADRLQPAPDLRHVLDPDPVVAGCSAGR